MTKPILISIGLATFAALLVLTVYIAWNWPHQATWGLIVLTAVYLVLAEKSAKEK